MSGGARADEVLLFVRVGGSGRPGDDLLSRVLRRSTIGAEGFHGRVRDGIGCFAPRYGHQAGQDRPRLSPGPTVAASPGMSPGTAGSELWLCLRGGFAAPRGDLWDQLSDL